MKKLNILIITAILVISAGLWALNSLYLKSSIQVDADTYAIVSVNSDHYMSIPLTAEEDIIEIKTIYGSNTLSKHDNGVEMIDSTCPDKICHTFGFISKPGQVIVCMPNRLIVHIDDEE